MTKGQNKALKRRALRKVLKNSMIGGRTKMLGDFARLGWGDGRPSRIRAEGNVR